MQETEGICGINNDIKFIFPIRLVIDLLEHIRRTFEVICLRITAYDLNLRLYICTYQFDEHASGQCECFH